MRILWKMMLWKCDFCEKLHFQNVNFVKNETLKMRFWSKNEILKCEFFDKLTIFALVWFCVSSKNLVISGQRWSLHYFPKEWSRRLGTSLWLRKYSHFTIDGNFWWHCFGNLDRGHHYGLLDHALPGQETLVGIWGREEREWEEIWREFQPTLWRCWFELGLKIEHFLSTKFFVILHLWYYAFEQNDK